MGRGVKGQKGSWTQGKGGWLQDWAQKGLKAVAFGEAYHCALLRPYPGEHGEVLIKKAGAKRDMDLLTLEGIASRLSPQNCEALLRPEKWISMLSACARQAHRVLPFTAEDPRRSGLPQVTEN